MRILIGIFFICLISPIDVLAQEESLKNLKSLNVVIEYFPAALQDSNLSRNQIKNDIEQKLKQNGIAINNDTTFSYLYLSINALSMDYEKGNPVRYIYNVELKLMQPVVLLRDDSIFDFGATTWSKKGLGYTTPLRLENDIKGMIDHLMKLFLNLYSKVNGS